MDGCLDEIKSCLKGYFSSVQKTLVYFYFQESNGWREVKTRFVYFCFFITNDPC